MKRSVLAGALVLFTAGLSHGGWLDNAIKSAGESLGRRAVDDAADSAYQGAKEGAKGAVKGESKEPESAPAPKWKLPPQTTEPREAAGAPARGGAESGRAAGGSIEAAEAVYSKYDFVPGDKVIFFDDFSDTDVGEFPRKWTLNGPKGGRNAAVEVVEYQGKRFLRTQPADEGQGQPESTQYIRLNQKRDLPDKFTVEFDAVLTNVSGGYPSNYYLLLFDEGDDSFTTFPGSGRVILLSGGSNASKNTTAAVDKADGKVHHAAVSVNGTFVKAYIDNARVVNDPDGATRPITRIGLCIESSGNVPNDKIMFTNFRLAEGGKSMKSALDTDGKIVTHGILFDTGKDVIKPESLPTLKSILALLNDNPDLKFSIGGHTDNQGDKAVNQPLSEKRAAAVKNWLAGKGIDGARLKTQGFGDTKPMDSNDTPEGRANNRRVEFVKF